MDDTVLTMLALAVGVALLYLGSVIRRRARRGQTPPPGRGPEGR